MEKLKHASTLATLILISTTLCWAQEKKAEVVVEYDRFENRSMVRLRPMIIARSTTDMLTLAGTFITEGPIALPTKRVDLHFISFAKEWMYRDGRTLILLTDGERLTLIPVLRDDEIKEGVAWESTSFNIDHETLVRIASAKKVEGRLGRREFELSKNGLEGLKELARRMQQPQ
jgi:hypothetical protein